MGGATVGLVTLALLFGGCILDWERGAGGSGAAGAGGAGASGGAGGDGAGTSGPSCTPEGACQCVPAANLFQCSCDGEDCTFDCSSGEICVVDGCTDCDVDCGANGCCTQPDDGQIVCFPGIMTSCDTPCP